jgi:hypothetical protein
MVALNGDKSILTINIKFKYMVGYKCKLKQGAHRGSLPASCSLSTTAPNVDQRQKTSKGKHLLSRRGKWHKKTSQCKFKSKTERPHGQGVRGTFWSWLKPGPHPGELSLRRKPPKYTCQHKPLFFLIKYY